MRRNLPTFLLLVAVALGGCADSSDLLEEGSVNSAEAGEGTDEPLTDEELIEDTLITWDLEGGCEHMTDKYLTSQTFIDDDRDAACQTWEALFVEKQYDADDIVISDIQVNGDTATAVFGSTISDLTVTYTLVKVDGRWLVDEYDY